MISYYDTSGSSSATRLMVTVGLVADEERWKRLELAWNKALPPDLPYLHMHKFHMAYWERYYEAEKLIRSLVDVVKQEIQQTFIAGLRVDHFDAVDADYELREHYGPPVACVAGMTVWQADTWIKEHHPEAAERRHVLEKGDTGRRRDGGWTRCMQSLARRGIVLDFKKKKDERGNVSVPFQCCDMIAWTYRRAMEDHLNRTMYRYGFWFQYMHELLPKGKTGTLDEAGLRGLCKDLPTLFPTRKCGQA